MSKPATLVWLTLGLAMVVAVRLLMRAETAHGLGQTRLPSPFGDAVAGLAAWMGLGGLLAASFYQLGALVTVLAGALALLAPRVLPAGPGLMPFFHLKLPLGLGAALAACVLLYGVLNHFEGVFYG